MYVLKLPNAAASKITVTNTATGIIDLIKTAAGGTDPNLTAANAIDIYPEDGDIRILFDGNTPTSTNGYLLKSEVPVFFRGIPLVNMKLIRVGGSNVTCSIQVGKSNPDESSVVGGGSGGGAVDTEFPSATAASDNYANPTTTDVKSFGMVFDGVTWDRMLGNSTDGILVNLGTNNDVINKALAATNANSGTVTATNGAGGTEIVAARATRDYCEFINTGGVTGYFGTGIVTSSFQPIASGETKVWNGQQALKVLSSGADIAIAFTDYYN